MPRSLVALVARATPLSLLCISYVLHVDIHPDRSARFARFARSLAALALPSWAVLGHLGAIVRRLGAILSRLISRLSAKLGPSSAVLKSSWAHLGPF